MSRQNPPAEPVSRSAGAAQATAAVEQRLARIREIFAAFTDSDITAHGFYAEPFARQTALGRAAREIKAAVQIISDTTWPDEDEATTAVHTNPKIAKLREQCRAEISGIRLILRDYEDLLIDACIDAELLTKLARGLSRYRQNLPNARGALAATRKR